VIRRLGVTIVLLMLLQGVSFAQSSGPPFSLNYLIGETKNKVYGQGQGYLDGYALQGVLIHILQSVELILGGAGGFQQFPAQNYGPCAQGASIVGQDLGACVNAAAAAAAAAGSGTVTVPPGNFTQSTPIVYNSSFVGLQCGGTGVPLNSASKFVAATTITATNAMSGQIQFSMTPAVGATSYLFGMRLQGCLFNSNGIASQGVYIANTAYSYLEIACEEATTICGQMYVYDLFSGQGGGPGPGNQEDVVKAYFKEINNPGTGFLINRGLFNGPDIPYNTSYSVIASVVGEYRDGDGFVVSGADNVTIGSVEEFNYLSSGGGKACVVANTGYVTPTGTTTFGIGGSIVFEHLGNPCLVLGYQTGFTPVFSGPGCGGCGPATVTLTTNGSESIGGSQLFFASTSGLVTDMAGSCTISGTSNMPGMLPGDQIFSVQANVSVTLVQPVVARVATGATCTFGSTIRGNAAPGTYVVSFDGALWSITAPAGGHSQTGISMSGGVAIFEDLIWSFQGTAQAGDTWTYTANQAPEAIILDGVDNVVNGVQYGVFQYGSFGWARYSGTFYGIPFATNGIGNAPLSLNGGGAIGVGCVSLSFYAGCTGAYSTGMGFSNGVAGLAGVSLGGENNNESGQYGVTGGNFANDNGLFNTFVRGGGNCNGQGSCQSFRTIVSNKGAGGATLTLTANLGNSNSSASLNCLNLVADNTSIAFSMTILIQQQGGANGESWNNWGMLLTRGTGVGSTTLFKATTPTALNSGVGGSVSVSQDATNGCVLTQVTLPAGGTWTATAIVDGALAK
jgi:hypothetical protein